VKQGESTDLAFSLFLEQATTGPAAATGVDSASAASEMLGPLDPSLVDVDGLGQKKKEPEKKKGARIAVSYSSPTGPYGMPPPAPAYGAPVPPYTPAYGMPPPYGMPPQPGYKW
jgi:hypothetical protein